MSMKSKNNKLNNFFLMSIFFFLFSYSFFGGSSSSSSVEPNQEVLHNIVFDDKEEEGLLYKVPEEVNRNEIDNFLNKINFYKLLYVFKLSYLKDIFILI